MLETVITLIATTLLFFKEEIKAWLKGRSL